MDLDLSVDIGQVEGTELAIGRGEVALTLEDGVLRIDPARFDFVAGTMLIHATADSRRKPPQIDLSLHADDVQLGEFLRAMGRTAPFTGELALILKLESRGDSPAQLVSSLDGEAQFALQRGGVDLGSLNLATADVLTWLLAGAERGSGVLRGITASGRTTLECFAGRFVIADGIATAQSLLMKTPLTISTATGTLDLVDQTIDLQAHLGARRESHVRPRADLPDPRAAERSGGRLQQDRLRRPGDRRAGPETARPVGLGAAAAGQRRRRGPEQPLPERGKLRDLPNLRVEPGAGTRPGGAR